MIFTVSFQFGIFYLFYLLGKNVLGISLQGRGIGRSFE